MSESQPFYKLYLQPLKKFPNPKEIVTFDIEATKWKDFAIAGVYDGKDYSKFASVAELLKFLLQRKFAGKLIFAHVLKYDGEFILDFLSRNRDFSFTPIINGGKLLEIKIRDIHKHVWRFRDSYSLLPASLKDLTKSFDVEHKKLDEDEKGMLTNPEYNRNDCMGLYEVLLKFRAINGGFFGMTISQTALSIFRMRYQKFPIRTVREVEPILRKAFYGGRTEIFKYNLNMDKRFYYYDVTCFSDDTEILTAEGWKNYQTLGIKDKVFGMKDEKLVKQDIRKIVIQPYKGKMIHLFNDNTDMFVTPNHRVYYKDYLRCDFYKKNGGIKRTRKRNSEFIPSYGWTDWKIKEAKDIPKSYIKFPNAREYCGEYPRYQINDDLIRLMAWFITEGHYINKNCVEISQSWSHNPDNCCEILDILSRLNIPFRRKDRFQKGKKYLYVYFDPSVFSSYLDYDVRSRQKVLPEDFMEYSLEQKRILFDTMMKGDGSVQNHKAHYVSYSDILLDQMQILATMLGIKCSVNYKHHSCNMKLWKNGDSMIKGKTEEMYDGVVWCVSVDCGNVVARRNGKVFISGNSLYPSVMRNFEYPYGEFKFCHPDIDKCGFSYAVADDTCYFPVLPQRIDKKMMFLQGRKEGWYSNQELKHVMNTTYGNVEIKSTIACDDFDYLFRDFVDDMFKIRQEAKASGNSALDYTQKILLNSSYGKWGQKRQKEQIVGNPQEDFFIEEGMIPDMVGSSSVYKKIVENDSPHIIPSLSALITANARLVMHRYLLGTKPEHIYYMDTDSLITDVPAFQVGDELGKFKLECEMTEFLAVLPKVYHFKYPSGRHCIKAKGLHLNYKDSDEVNVGCFKEFISGHEVIDDRGIEGFKRSCQLQKKTGDNTLLFNKAMKKSMHSYYDKRRLTPDQDLDMACEPFKVGEDRSVNEAPFKELLQRTLVCLNR
jgi:hypothetical protein